MAKSQLAAASQRSEAVGGMPVPRDGARRTRRPMRRLTALVAASLLAGLGAIGGLASPASALAITSSGPLTTVDIGASLNCAVNHTGDSSPEFFGTTACATLLATGGALYGPPTIPAGGSASPRTSYTPVSQASSGTGTAADPFTIVTVVDAGTSGVRLTQTDSYVVGQESYRTDVRVTNTTNAPVSAVLYKAGDCFLQNSDSGYGAYDSTSGAISCVAPGPQGGPPAPGARIEQLYPLTAGSSYLESDFNSVWAAVGTQQPLPNQCAACTTNIDNGMGLSWSLSIAAGATTTLSHFTTFSPLGIAPLRTTKVADSAAAAPGAADGYTITVTNGNATPITLSSIVDTLPADFVYRSGSSTGATSSDPTRAGQTLTWTGSFTVPANSALSLHFGVGVSLSPGQYFNEATATSGGVAVAPTGPTAPVTVGGSATVQYVMVAKDGGVFAPGGQGFYGTASVRPGDGILRDARGRIIGASGSALDSPVVAFAYTPSRRGYWLVQANGGVIPIGDAANLGNLRSVALRSPIVGAAATRDGGGLYLVAGDGGVFALGSAPFKGGLGGLRLNKPIVGMALDGDGSGYLLAASDGGVFAFDALFRGSLGATPLNKPIVGMAVNAAGGYALAATDGGVFTYGFAFAGSLGGVRLQAPIVGIAADPDGGGYWMAGADGGAFAFDAQFFGSVAPLLLNSPISGIAAL